MLNKFLWKDKGDGKKTLTIKPQCSYDIAVVCFLAAFCANSAWLYFTPR